MLTELFEEGDHRCSPVIGAVLRRKKTNGVLSVGMTNVQTNQMVVKISTRSFQPSRFGWLIRAGTCRDGCVRAVQRGRTAWVDGVRGGCEAKVEEGRLWAMIHQSANGYRR